MMKFEGVVPNEQELSVNVVRYGATAIEGYTGHKKVPIVGLDLTNRPDIKDLILIHKETPPGDVITQWGARKYKKSHLHLLFSFERPSRIQFILPLDVSKHSWLIEGIHDSKIIFLKEAKEDETTEEMILGLKSSISIEIGAEEFPLDWRKWRFEAIKKDLRKSGHSRKDAAKMAKELIRSHEMFWKEPVNYDDCNV